MTTDVLFHVGNNRLKVSEVTFVHLQCKWTIIMTRATQAILGWM